MSKKKIAILIICVVALVATIFAFDFSEDFKKTTYAMATQVDVSLKGKNCENIYDEINKRIVECENREISRNVLTSEISKINELKSYEVSDKTLSYIKKMIDFSGSCDGAVDVTVGNLTSAWGIGTKDFKVLEKEEIEKLLDGVGYKNIQIENNKVTVSENQSLDFGCVGKGIACDEALEIIKKSDLKNAVVSVGGSAVLWSEKNDKEFSVGIREPQRDSADYIITVDTNNIFVSTSGTYERFSVDENGKTYHHILSTETGYPVQNAILSVSVFCDEGWLSDALSSACLVMGYEESANLLEKYDAQAVFVFKDKSVKVSDGFSLKLNIVSEGYKLIEKDS